MKRAADERRDKPCGPLASICWSWAAEINAVISSKAGSMQEPWSGSIPCHIERPAEPAKGLEKCYAGAKLKDFPWIRDSCTGLRFMVAGAMSGDAARAVLCSCSQRICKCLPELGRVELTVPSEDSHCQM